MLKNWNVKRHLSCHFHKYLIQLNIIQYAENLDEETLFKLSHFKSIKFQIANC